jgi:glycine oxidase
MKVVIIGAGVAGLAIGWRLAQRGCSVEILERGVVGRGATWASAGMIAPGAELDEPGDALAQFAREARTKWPSFAREIESASGRLIDYVESGSLLIAETGERARVLETKAAELAAAGSKAGWLVREKALAREPLLSGDVHGALHVPDDAHVDNRVLAEALLAACIAAGVRMREHCDVRSILVEAGRAHAVIVNDGTIRADVIVLACGAWMNLIGGPGTEDLPGIKPVKGQMVACERPAGVRLPAALIWGEGVYLVPRRGRLLVGATVEDAGFDTSVSREVCERLIGAAARIVSALRDWPVAEMWAGLRPRSADDLPVLGASAIAGLYIASGQFRNGILFAPAVADALTAAILGDVSTTAWTVFDPSRFSHSS